MKHIRPRNRLAWLACLLAVGAATAARPVRPRPVIPTSPRRASSAFNLFAGIRGAAVTLLSGNRVSCNVYDFGNICLTPFESGNMEAGTWPPGTVDNYVYNSGLQLAAVVPSNAGFKWAGDTVGVFFMDARGPQRMGSTVSGVFDSKNANDLAVWPTAAYITDTSLFDARLVGRAAISDQDTWVRYWDGDLNVGTGRSHAMGMVVDQRTVAWNHPGWNSDIVYIVFRLINVTSSLSSSYAGLAAYGYSFADQLQLAKLGAQFRDSAQGRDSKLVLPDSGYTFGNLYAAFAQDPDVGFQNDHNYSTAVLPFSLVAAMKSNYYEPWWQFPATFFSAPFGAAPGFVAIQLLKTPIVPGSSPPRSLGLTFWSNTSNYFGSSSPPGSPGDPIGVSQLYRYLSGKPNAQAEGWSCNSDPVQLHTCYANQQYADTRFFMSTGPMDLGPGQSAVIAVAMFLAAPVDSLPATTNGPYSMPAFNLSTYVGTGNATFQPGFPAVPETLAVVGGARVRPPVERAMGWGQFSDVNGDGRIEPAEVQTTPGSLLAKAQIAQALFDHRFLVSAPPDAPRFILVPGDGQVTVAWQKSATETTGDPYFAVASDPTTDIYDPDYRQFDVEGYRIWRGTSASNLKVIAQFDYQGTAFSDYTGQIYDSVAYGSRCAPELGITTSCPAFPHNTPLVGTVVQVVPGGRVLLADGSILVVRTDTAVTGGGSGLPPLVDNGVPFVYTDAAVRNGFSYVYAVTAFDVNSIASGMSSLESPLVPRSVTPRVGSGQETTGGVSPPALYGAAGDSLDPFAPIPALDKNTGEFAGPMPPANGLGLGLVGFVPQVADSGAVTVTIDSIVPFGRPGGVAGTYFVSVQSSLGVSTRQIPILIDSAAESGDTSDQFPALKGVQAKSVRYGGDSTFRLYGTLNLRWPGTWMLTNWGRGSSIFYNVAFNGPRWWAGSVNENTPNPNGGMCNPAGDACGASTPVPNLGLTAGSLPGVNLMLIEGYSTVPSVPARYLHLMAAYVARAADFRVYWGTGGVVDSVVDVTHRVPVPFRPNLRASWGILTDSSFTNTAAASTPDQNDATLTWQDIFCVDPVPATLGTVTGCTGTAPAFLMNHARLAPVVFGSSAFGVTAPAATGSGFIFYIAGQFFLMQMAALPAAGTVWSLRTYAGEINGSPGNFAFGFLYPTSNYRIVRPPAVPGLRIRLLYRGTVLNSKSTTAAELAAVHTVPDPYYNHSAFETQGGERQLRFVNLPAQCLIRIYSASGILVTMLVHNDATGGGEEPWNLLSRNGHDVASGVYFYHVETPDRRSKVGRLTVVKVTN
jgi:hypothetical protein